MGMGKHSDAETLERIQSALQAATRALSIFLPGNVKAEYKSGNHLVTEADRVANWVLRETLVRDDEGWLSEESTDDLNRLEKERVWIVDPVDGTREFLAGIPEWCISIALVEHGQVVAGGIRGNGKHPQLDSGSEDDDAYQPFAHSRDALATDRWATVLNNHNETPPCRSYASAPSSQLTSSRLRI